MSEYKPYSIIGIIMALIIVLGTLLTTASLKLLGYPDNDQYRWNPISTWIREHGFVVLALPFIWIALVFVYLNKNQKNDTRSNAMIGGLITLGVLAVFYIWTTALPGTGRLIQTTPG